MAFEIVETLFRGICVGVAASITVGPVAVLCIQRTLSKSRRSGIVSGIGVACADTFMAMAALFFYSMLQTQIEQYNTLLRVIGGIFVVIVGVFIFAQNPVPQIRRNRAGKTSLWQDFASIFGLTIANFIMVIPYILAFFAVFKISGGDMADHTFGGFMRSLFVIAGFFGGAVAWWTLLAFVINLFRRRFLHAEGRLLRFGGQDAAAAVEGAGLLQGLGGRQVRRGHGGSCEGFPAGQQADGGRQGG